MKVVRLGALIALTLGLVACASGAPPANVSDSGVTKYIVAGGAAKGGGGGSGGSSGTGGSGGSPVMMHTTEPPLIFPDASYPDAGHPDAAVDAGPPQHTCDDKKKNGAETATDCGGGECDPCPDGKGCVTG